MAIVDVDYQKEMLKLLNEEKLSKHSLDDYSRRDFVKVESIVDQAISLGEENNLQSICEDYLKDEPNSIFSLYAVGMILLKKGSIDPHYMPEVLLRFSESKKLSIAVFLAEKIVSYREEKYALKLLEEYYKNENRKEELIDVREKLVRVDTKDAYTPKLLGEYYENEGNISKATYYYKISLERFISSRNSSSASAVFEKILSLHSVDVKYILNVSLRILDLVAHDKVGKLLYKLALHFKKREMYYEALDILKFVVSRCMPNDAGIRNDLKEVYESIYPNHSLLPKYWNEFVEFMRKRLHVRVNPSEIMDKLSEFEKKLRFDIGVYVYHKSFGVGVISDVQDDWIVIDFTSKKQHRMSNSIAFYSLDVLSLDDIRVWKEYKKEELVKLIENYSPEVIKMVLVSLGNKATVKEIKDVLKTLMNEKEVDNFWAKVRSNLDKVNVTVSPESKNTYIYLGERKLEESIREKINIAKTFDEKVKFVYNFLTQVDTLDVPQAGPIVEFLNDTVETSNNKFEVVEAGIILMLKHGDLKQGVREKVLGVIRDMTEDEIVDFVTKVEFADVRKYFLNIVKELFENWSNIFIKVLFSTDAVRLNNYILYELISYDKIDAVKSIVTSIIDSVNNVRGNRFKSYLKFMWLAKMVFQKEYEDVFRYVGIQKVNILLMVSNILYSIQYSFEERGEKGISKRIYSLAKEIFDNYQEIEKVVVDSGKNTSFILLSCIQEFDLLGVKEISLLRQKLYYKYPDLKDMEDTRDKRSASMITKSTYEKIRNEYNRILNDELPKISKAIASSPTPELIEKEEELKALVEQMAKELSEYKIINPDSISKNYVDVGTKVLLKSKKTGDEFVYHILGDKDADLSKNIISYRSPLGVKIIEKEVGDIVSLNIRGDEEDFEIKSISISEYV